MMNQFIVDTALLKDYFDILGETCVEAIVNVYPDRLYTRVVDSANVALNDIQIPCLAEEEWIFAIDIQKLKPVLKNLKEPTTTIKLEGNKIVIETTRVVYKITTLDLRTVRKQPENKDAPYLAVLQVPIADLNEVLAAILTTKSKKDSGIFAWFKWDLRDLYIASDNQMDPVTGTFSGETKEVIPLRPSEVPCISAISLDYLENMKSSLSSFDNCMIGIGNNVPIGFMVSSEEGMKFAFLIAPRIPKEGEICPV